MYALKSGISAYHMCRSAVAWKSSKLQELDISLPQDYCYFSSIAVCGLEVCCISQNPHSMHAQQCVHSCNSKIATDRVKRVEEAARIYCYLTHELQTHTHTHVCACIWILQYTLTRALALRPVIIPTFYLLVWAQKSNKICLYACVCVI